jgi:hypothetical protein
MGLDTKTYWLSDRQSQCDFDFDFDFDPVSCQLKVSLRKKDEEVGVMAANLGIS